MGCITIYAIEVDDALEIAEQTEYRLDRGRDRRIRRSLTGQKRALGGADEIAGKHGLARLPFVDGVIERT